MRRELLRSSAFLRAARRLAKKHPDAVAGLRATLEQLAEDAFHPSLKTHKLKGDLDGSWACSAGYDLRIVFEFVQHEGREAAGGRVVSPSPSLPLDRCGRGKVVARAAACPGACPHDPRGSARRRGGRLREV